MPPLSPCLRGTLLAWVPCVFLWVAAPFEFYRIACSEDTPLRWSVLSSIKMILSAATASAHLSMLLSEDGLLMEEFTGTTFKLFTLVLACVLQSMMRMGGLSSSAVQFGFWLLFSTTSAITCISIYTDTLEYRSWSNSGAHMHCVVVIMSLVVLVMNSFTDLSRREKQRVRAPVTESSFPSRMTFQWMNPLIVKGFRTTLTQDDIPAMADDMDPAACSDMLLRHWRPEVKTEGPGGGKKLVHRRSLLFSLLKAFAGPLIQIAALETIFCVGMFVPIYLMDVLIQFGGSREPTWKGYLYAVLMALASVLVNLLYSQVYYLSSVLALRVKTALIAFLYRKVLTAWSTGGEQRSAGEVINSITLDSDKVYQAVLFAGELWGAPLRLLITMAMLWQYLGPSCLVAVAVVLVVLFASFFFARRVQVVQTAQMEKKDKRVKYVHELFSGIKILKLYAWEEPFQQRVVDVRKSEMEMLRKIAFYFSLMNFVWNCISFLVSLVTFMTFLLVGSHGLDPVTAFVSLALFNTLRFSLLLIPDLIVGCVVCNVAMGRMKDFLLSEDVDPKQVGSQPDPGDAVTIRQASFSWHRQEGRMVLQDVDVRIAQGQLVAVVGQVGSGKTSFLSAILGELRCVKGSLDRKGKVAYVAQQAWIQNATVRQNILLKRQHHACFYGRVVQACQLQTDLAELAAGDQTELGMRGVNLSGGQKQRINLARAVYQNADLYIMDDPLSAVDAQVGSALFHGVIGPRGLLRKKTRVLATNTMSVLPLTDMVIVLHEGRVKEIYRAPYGQRLFDKGLALNVLISSPPAAHQQPHQQQGATDGAAPRALLRAVYDEK
ncbi:multidrug resistance-associated protein 1-like [Rhipicephalus sanguineus]|uniref:multidrug resistance-associated protein 1-like n=1 Tax=Rhipicephalus sanguineus TaxID=34632 RepID=UPI0020C3A112|nr:multidrug resistance-associated protein 1-like [Rhipicephalus sanguineus]